MKPCSTVGSTVGSFSVLKYLGIALGVALLQAASAPRADAIPMPFGSNHYEFVEVADPFTGNNNSFATASAAAAASFFNSVSGHLATVTSSEENDFLKSLVSGSFAGFTGAWLGGKAPEGWLVGPEAGQPFGFTSWGGIEPNNAGYAYMDIGSSSTVIGFGKWADDSGVQGVPDASADPVIGYFVEYEQTVAVPEPSTLLLLAPYFGGVALRRKRRASTR